MYNKLFTKILDSTIWLEPDAHRIVWITFLAAMDEDGFVAFASVANVANRARVSLEAASTAIKAFESPDPHGSDQPHEGRRIERVESGWLVLNAAKYREMVTRIVAREQARRRNIAYRDRQRAKEHAVTERDGSVTPRDASVTHARRSVTPSEVVSDTDAVSPKSGAARPTSEAKETPNWASVEKLEQEAWAIWLAFRRKMRLKSYVDTRMAKRLAAYPPETQLAAIEESMTQNWAGLFPEKVKQHGTSQSGTSGGTETAYERSRRRLREWAEARGLDTSLLPSR